MKKSVWFIVLVVGVIFVCSSSNIIAADAAAEVELKGPEQVVLPAKMGAVTFQHFAHQAKVADCMSCHHQGVEAGACTSCHGVNDEVLSAKEAFHKQCKSCHQKEGGPTSCKSCHVK